MADKEHLRGGRRRGRRWLIAGAAVVVAGAGAFVAVRATGHQTPRHAIRAAAAKPRARRPAATTTTTPPPLAVDSILPPNGAKGVPYASTITIHLSGPLAPGSPMPVLSPPLAGSWAQPAPGTLTFSPASPIVPSTVVHVSIPVGPAGAVGAEGQQLAGPFRASFTVMAGSVLRLQQLLAQLSYLPVGFSKAVGAEPGMPSQVSLEPQPGSFSWRFPNVPPQLAGLWSAGENNVLTEGAVMAFESDHGLAADGQAGPLVWSALLKAVASREATARPYDYLLVSESLPETLYVWRDGSVVYQSAANTGVTGASTALGTWPVYLRFLATTMSGTNPNGSHYKDPGVPFVSYFNGSDAVHGFVRSRYGFPQSDGCVELPPANAEKVYPLDPLGTLVTVTTGNLTPELASAGAVPPTTLPAAPAPPTTPPTTTPPRLTASVPAPSPATSKTVPAADR